MDLKCLHICSRVHGYNKTQIYCVFMIFLTFLYCLQFWADKKYHFKKKMAYQRNAVARRQKFDFYPITTPLSELERRILHIVGSEESWPEMKRATPAVSYLYVMLLPTNYFSSVYGPTIIRVCLFKHTCGTKSCIRRIEAWGTT